MNTNKPARWFRMYAEFASDPKVQMLSECYQRRYMMLLCLRCSNGDVTLQDTEVAFQLRIDVTEWVETKRVLVDKNLINDDNQPTAWDKRQFASDSSAERVAKHRANKKEQCNVTVTPPEKEKEKEKETKEEKDITTRAPRFDAVQHLVSLGVFEQVARDYCQQRKKKPTMTAINGIYKQAQKAGISLNKALEICCARGWEGFKAEWITENRNDKRTEHQKRQDATARALLGDAYYATPTMKAIEGEVIHEEPPFTRRLG